MIASIMLEIGKLNLHSPKRYKFTFKKDSLPKNTDFMAFLRYRKDQAKFKVALVNMYHGDLKYFLSDVVEKSQNNEKLPF